MLRIFGRRWATDLPRTGCLLIRPYFSKWCVLESRLKRASVPCPETGFENRVDHRPCGLGHHSKLGHQGKLGSQSLCFDYLAPIDETMLQLNPIING
jgi:hypothetical protein